MMEFARVGILFGKLCIFTKLTKKRFEESRGEEGGDRCGRRCERRRGGRKEEGRERTNENNKQLTVLKIHKSSECDHPS